MSNYVMLVDYNDPKTGISLKKGQILYGEFRGKTPPNTNNFVRVYIGDGNKSYIPDSNESLDSYKILDFVDGFHVKSTDVISPGGSNSSSNTSSNGIFKRFSDDIIDRKIYYASFAVLGLGSGYAYSRLYKKITSNKTVAKYSISFALVSVFITGIISLRTNKKG